MNQEALRYVVANYYNERFGVLPQVMELYRLVLKGHMVWATTARVELARELNVLSAGVRILRLNRNTGILKPTTAGLQLFAPHLRKNIVRISTEQLVELGCHGCVILDSTSLTCAEDGFVAVMWKRWVVGCGKLEANKLFNQIPSGRLRELVECLSTHAHTR